MGLSLFSFEQARRATRSAKEAERESHISRSERLAASANLVMANQDDRFGSLALLLAHAAVDATRTLSDGLVLDNAYAALVDAIEYAPPWRMTIPRAMHTAPVHDVAYSPDGRYLALASYISGIWEAQTLQRVQVLAGFLGVPDDVAFSPDGSLVVTASNDQTARIWETTSGHELHVLRHPDPVVAARFSPHGEYILTATGAFVDPDGPDESDGDAAAFLWDARTGTLIRTFMGHTDRLMSAVFSPDGQYVLTGSQDNTARLWDAASGQQLSLFKGDPDGVDRGVTAVAFHPSGEIIATAGGVGDAQVYLWNLATDSEYGRTHGLTAPASITAVEFSPDGSRLLFTHYAHGTPSTQGEDSVRIWDLASMQEVRKLSGHSDLVMSATFAPDGKSVLTASIDGTARIWPDADILLQIAERQIQRQPPLFTPEEMQRYGFGP